MSQKLSEFKTASHSASDRQWVVTAPFAVTLTYWFASIAGALAVLGI